MEEPTFTGCFVAAHLIGLIEAEQNEWDGQMQRNDPLIAVAAHSHTYKTITSLEELEAALVDEIEHCFVSYNKVKGKVSRPTGKSVPARAQQIVEEGSIPQDEGSIPQDV